MTVRRRVLAGTSALAMTVVLGLTACSGGAGGGSSVLTMGVPGSTTTNNQNPLVGSSAASAQGYANLLYEPLVEANEADPTEDPQPWLAKSFSWSTDYKTFTATVRSGVKWSDGKPFTVADAAFTFGLLKQDAALNLDALPVSAVSTSGDALTVTFSRPMYVDQTKVYRVLMLPQHVWSKVGEPSTFTNTKPVGTGPYTLQTWTPQTQTLAARKDYWHGAVPVPLIRYTAYTDNSSALTSFLSNRVDNIFIAVQNYQKVILAKSKDFHAYLPTGLTVDSLILNAKTGPFADPALRRALNKVVDRDAVQKQGFGGFKQAVSSVTGLPTPVGDDYIAAAYKGKDLTVDVAGAKRILTDAGYTFSGGNLMKGGKQVEARFIVPAAFSDYLASTQVIAGEAKRIGLKVDVQTPSVDGWNDAYSKGSFDGAVHWGDPGSTPWNLYACVMDGGYLKPLGSLASLNTGRFDDPAATKALSAYAVASTDSARATALAAAQQIYVDDVPAIPLAAGPVGSFSSTRNWTGWPTAQDAYANSQPQSRGILTTVLHLKPAR